MAEKITIEIEAKVNEAVEGINEVNDEIKDVKKNTEESADGIKKMSKGFSAMGLTLKALGIGLVLKAFEVLSDVFMSNQKVMDFFNTGLEIMNQLFSQLVNFITGENGLGNRLKAVFENPKQAVIDLWQAIKENLVNRMEGLIDSFTAFGKVIKSALSLDWEGLKEGAKDFGGSFQQIFTGKTIEDWQEVAKSTKTFFENTKNNVKETIKFSQALVELRNKVQLLEAEQQKILFTYLKEAELQRQLRDDVSLTIDERIKANEKLGEVLSEQIEKEKEIINEKIRLAEMELKADENNIEAQANLIMVQNELLDLEERITGQRSEQMTNTNALLQEQRDMLNEVNEIGVVGREAELIALDNHYRELLEKARKSGADINNVEKFYANERKKINIASVSAQLDAFSGLTGAMGSLLEEGSKGQKAFAITQLLIDTAKGISGAISSGAGVPFPGNLVAIATGIGVVMSNIANARNILKKADVDVNVDGVDDGGGGGGVAPISAPAITPFIPEGISTTAPLQAFVVSEDVTSSQNLENELYLQSTL